MRKIKGKVMPILIAFGVGILIFYACSKNKTTHDPNLVNVAGNVSSSESAKQITEPILLDNSTMKQFETDEDYKNIEKKAKDLMLKLLNQKTLDLSKIDWFNDKESALAAIGMTNEQYNQLALDMQNSAKSLQSKFIIRPVTCTFCDLAQEQKTNKFRKLITMIDENRGYQSILFRQTGGGGCKWEYYACGILCLAAGEVPPLFLLCVGLCACSYCDPPPPFCSSMGGA